MRKILLCAACLLCSACAPMIDTHGTLPTPEQMNALQPGKTPFTQVQRLLGTPTSKTVFGREYWLYVYSQQKRMAFFAPEEIARTVTVLEFDDRGILSDITVKDLKDGYKIAYDPETTPISSHNMSVVDQLIDNVGRFRQQPTGPAR